jgi:hypothetical protein
MLRPWDRIHLYYTEQSTTPTSTFTWRHYPYCKGLSQPTGANLQYYPPLQLLLIGKVCSRTPKVTSVRRVSNEWQPQSGSGVLFPPPPEVWALAERYHERSTVAPYKSVSQHVVANVNEEHMRTGSSYSKLIWKSVYMKAELHMANLSYPTHLQKVIQKCLIYKQKVIWWSWWINWSSDKKERMQRTVACRKGAGVLPVVEVAWHLRGML